jgi:hypothetical protein
MPLSGTIERQVSFKRSVSGSVYMSGIASGSKAIVKAIAGVLQLTSGILARKVNFKRSLDASLTMSGVGQKVYAKFKRAVSGNLYMTAGLQAVTGLAELITGILQLTGGAIARKVTYKRAAVGSLFMSGIGTIVGADRVRSVGGALHFIGRASIASVTTLKRGLTKLGFSPKDQ